MSATVLFFFTFTTALTPLTLPWAYVMRMVWSTAAAVGLAAVVGLVGAAALGEFGAADGEGLAEAVGPLLPAQPVRTIALRAIVTAGVVHFMAVFRSRGGVEQVLG
jgi:hypothetical protein